MDFTVYLEFFPIIIILTILFSFLIDFVIGDPKSKYHPVMLIGKTLNWFKIKLRTGKSNLDKLLGIFLLLIVVIVYCIPILFLQIFLWWIWNIWDQKGWKEPNILFILTICFFLGFLLKWTFAVKSLGQAILPISKALFDENIHKARSDLSLIVRRDTDILDISYIISATVECIAESSTDAVTSVIWFYLMGNLIGAVVFAFIHNHIFWLFLGIPFAYAFRIINTADSVVGYKDKEHINIGWFSARMDDISNYIPTRLTVLFMLIAGKILNKNVTNAKAVLKLDRKKTESVNAGWTMGTMAGLLNIQIEKRGKYKLGFPNRDLEAKNIKSAYQIFLLTVFLYVLVLSTGAILIVYLIITF